MDTYILQKKLPDSNPGDKYMWNDSMKAYYKNGNVQDSYWTATYVENNEDWFVKEERQYTYVDMLNCFEAARTRIKDVDDFVPRYRTFTEYMLFLKGKEL